MDPERSVRVLVRAADDHVARMVDALTFEPSTPPTYQEAIPGRLKVRSKLKKDLKRVLGLWLPNLAGEGHRLVNAENHPP